MKRMNAELIRIRDNLVCGHCEAVFAGSNSQAYHKKYEGRAPYCSTACRQAAVRKKLCTPIPDRGPCRRCGKPFRSRTAKQYCSMDCYISSDAFYTMLCANRMKLAQMPSWNAGKRTGEYKPCLECGEEVYNKPSEKKKFCSSICYRQYMAKRFDRWVANPQEMALPQCFDEFMSTDELPCLVEGCDWVGQHLGGHVQLAHGILANEFKRAAGFNLSTGLVGADLHRKMVDASSGKGNLEQMLAARLLLGKPGMIYQSLEGREHQQKSRVVASEIPGPMRDCKGCGKTFRQKNHYGRTKFCTIECRKQFYAATLRSQSKKRSRDSAGKFVWVSK
ncbi:hypothetical protein [uncultured Marinobacter sp.]|uniref:hypothetical protein n=1 Tax=uncultured Marinobacter sp. TaxID=187379 RepID=UPI0030DC2708